MAPHAAFTNSGQDCCARSRLIVHESIRDEFVEAYVRAAEALPIGDPLDEGTVIGPLVSSRHRDEVHEIIERGKLDGAEVLCGGESLRVEGLEQGAYYAPTVLSGSLWTSDLGCALRVSRRIDTGVLSVNSNTSVFFSAPFGGRKDSGLGHEYGLLSLQENCQIKSTYLAM